MSYFCAALMQATMAYSAHCSGPCTLRKIETNELLLVRESIPSGWSVSLHAVYERCSNFYLLRGHVLLPVFNILDQRAIVINNFSVAIRHYACEN